MRSTPLLLIVIIIGGGLGQHLLAADTATTLGRPVWASQFGSDGQRCCPIPPYCCCCCGPLAGDHVEQGKLIRPLVGIADPSSSFACPCLALFACTSGEDQRLDRCAEFIRASYQGEVDWCTQTDQAVECDHGHATTIGFGALAIQMRPDAGYGIAVTCLGCVPCGPSD